MTQANKISRQYHVNNSLINQVFGEVHSLDKSRKASYSSKK